MRGTSVRRSRRAGVLMVAALAAGLPVAVGTAVQAAPARASAPAGSSAPDAAPDAHAKPFTPGSIRIDPASLADGGRSIAVTTDPAAGRTGTTLVVGASGDASVRGGQQAVPASASTVTVPATAAGPGRITATLTGNGADGSRTTVSDTVWTDVVAGQVLVSEAGEQDLRLQGVDALLRAEEINPTQAAALRDEILGGTDDTIVVGAGPCVGDVVCVHGTVRWTDSAGGTHPVRKAPVEIYDAEAIGADELVTTVTTADDGTYSATINNDDGPVQGGRDVFVRVQAAGPGFDINQHIESATTDDVANGTDLTVDLTANKTADNNTAFSLQAALVVGNEYLEATRGSRFADFEVDYPTTDSTSNFGGGKLHVLQLDRWDWDVILHEFGHFVADQLNIEDNPGGEHSFGENLSDRVGKDAGTRLAFGEGWPSYFAVSLLRVGDTSALGIPLIGDIFYQDTEDTNITINLETASTVGEDNEVTNMGILWDLYDSEVDGRDRLALGDKTVWNTLDAGDPKTLSATYKLFAPSDGANSNDLNCIFTQLNVSPTLAGADQVLAGDDTPSPALTWMAGNGGGFKNNKFVVEYRGAAGGLLFASPELDTTSYTAPEADWDAVQRDALGLVNVTVVARQTGVPETGKYRSCRKQYLSRSLDLMFVIDTTGSMFDDIAAVQAQAAEITNTLLGAGGDVRIGLVDYKDANSGDPYQARVDVNLTDDPAAVIAGLNALGADGGGDYPESVYAGVLTALAQAWRPDVEKKAIIVMGDAPAQDPEPGTGTTLAQVIAALAAGGVSSSGPGAAPVTDVAAAAAADGVSASVYSIIIGGEAQATASLTALAERSGGEAFPAGNAGDVVAAILRSITAIFNAPVAVSGGPYTGSIGQAISFDGSASYDPDGTVVKWEWDFDNNGTYDEVSALPGASYSYGAAYNGLVKLRVTDNGGATGVSTSAVTITGATNPAGDGSFVKAAYADFLNRPPTPAELAAAIESLKTGRQTRADVVAGLANSPEWVSAIVNQMYVDTLGRKGEAGGVAFWTRQIQTKRRSVAQVAALFYSSSEYYNGLGGGTDTSWVTNLYSKLLGRTPDAGGLAYWSAKAGAGREKVALGFYQSLESRNTRVERLYVKLLGRSSDAAGRAFWAGRILVEGDVVLAADLASSNEYATRAATRFPA